MRQIDRLLSKAYQYAAIVTGAAATVTLTNVSFDFSVVVGLPGGTSTDSCTIKLNGGTAITLYQGEVLKCTTMGVTAFTHTAVSGTPTIRYTAFEIA